MKGLTRPVCLCLCIFASLQSAWAQVQLSPDGRTLSGVEVEGKKYNVQFGDGIISQVYPRSSIDQATWNAFASSAVIAVRDALLANYPNISTTVINGCEQRGCELFLPLRPSESNIASAYVMGRVVNVDVPPKWRLGIWPQYDANTNTGAIGDVTLMALQPASGTPEDDFILSLEEPIDGEIHQGIGNLRGWALAEEGIDRIEMWLNGSFLFEIPYGGDRPDVADAFPEVEGAQQSGFGMAFGYSNLGAGTHRMTARAYDKNGEVREDSATFTVVAFHKNFIFSTDEVSTNDASCDLGDDEIRLEDVSIDDKQYDLLLKWRTAEQGFEIIEID
jgi:hypothetical protein